MSGYIGSVTGTFTLISLSPRRVSERAELSTSGERERIIGYVAQPSIPAQVHNTTRGRVSVGESAEEAVRMLPRPTRRSRTRVYTRSLEGVYQYIRRCLAGTVGFTSLPRSRRSPLSARLTSRSCRTCPTKIAGSSDRHENFDTRRSGIPGFCAIPRDHPSIFLSHSPFSLSLSFSLVLPSF